MVGIPGPELTQADRTLLIEHRIGNLCLFSRNLHDPVQAKALCESLQDLARRELPAPIVIATDQEGGPVQRLTTATTPLPSAMAVGVAGPDAAREVGYVCGRELSAVGVNLALAPVLDVNVNPRNAVIGIRSFGDSPETVAACGRAAIAGLQAAGVAATAKHFPGHGDTSVDSHLAVPVLDHGRDRLESVELRPFREAIAAGVDSVMVGHIALPSLDPSGTPASLSPELNAGLLRGTLGYEGVVCTDCLEMAGAHGQFDDFGEVVVRAFIAGADMVLVSHRRDRQLAAARALHQAVATGRIGEARLRESAARVMRLKDRPASAPRAPIAEVGCAAHLSLINQVAARAIRVKRSGVLPSTRKTGVVAFGGQALNQAESARGDAFLNAAQGRGLPTLSLPLEPKEAFQAEAVRFGEVADQLIVGSRGMITRPQQAGVARALARLKPTALVALREPYDLDLVPEAVVLVAAYGDGESQSRAALATVMGAS